MKIIKNMKIMKIQKLRNFPLNPHKKSFMVAQSAKSCKPNAFQNDAAVKIRWQIANWTLINIRVGEQKKIRN